MTRLVTSATVEAATLAALLTPRDDIVAERALGTGVFEAADGPFAHYRRTVEVAAGPDGAEGHRAVTQVTEFRLAIPVWGIPFRWAYRRELSRLTRRRPGSTPWWAPPQRLDARGAAVLGMLCSLSLVVGYLGTLLTQTITFAAEEFDAGTGAQGVTLAAVRVGVVGALVVTALADRRGRRRLLVWSAAAGCVLAALGALSPNLAVLGLTQALSRAAGATALGLLIAIVAAEELPAGSRAYGYSLLAMVGGLGAGMAVWVLPLADLGPAAWRIVYAVPLLALPMIVAIGRNLPESRRFAAPHVDAPMAGHGRRFWLLAASAFLAALFIAPASQFQNEFLRDERGFSAARITLFTLLTNTPGGIGIVVGGRLADIRGRRVIGAVGMAGGALLTVAMFLASGWPLWAWSVAGAVIGGLTVPALAVYGPELFPTSLRGRANGIISLVSVVGSGLGLLVAGLLADRLGGFGPTMALLAIGPVLVGVLVITAYPETAHQELEELNPEDALPAADGIAPGARRYARPS
ncbi:hypothetical protein BH20ACT2_BH20ACT2_09730 [soil metagenome]